VITRGVQNVSNGQVLEPDEDTRRRAAKGEDNKTGECVVIFKVAPPSARNEYGGKRGTQGKWPNDCKNRLHRGVWKKKRQEDVTLGKSKTGAIRAVNRVVEKAKGVEPRATCVKKTQRHVNWSKESKVPPKGTKTMRKNPNKAEKRDEAQKTQNKKNKHRA